jgi:hypothetical protein
MEKDLLNSYNNKKPDRPQITVFLEPWENYRTTK